MKPAHFQRFAEKEYQISQWADIQKDSARKKPEIATGDVYKSVVYQPVLGQESLVQLDQFARTPEARQLIGSQRKMVTSDSTAIRVAAAMDKDRLRQSTYGVHLVMRQKGHVTTKLSSGRKVQLAVVDGTQMGHHGFSVLGFAGRIYHSVDCESCPGRGHELATSRTLMDRACEMLDRGFATHLLYDGLMANRLDFVRAREQWDMHLVVKTQEDTLEIIKSSKQVWSQLSEKELKRAGVEIIHGLDEERMVRYTVYAQGEIQWEGLRYPLKVAWRREKHLKGKYKGETIESWVITTDQTLTAQDLWEVPFNRWKIETNGFKELNEQVKSKRAYIKNDQVKEALLLMWFVGMAVLKAFEWVLAQSKVWLKWGVRKTKHLIAQVILSSIVCEAVVSKSPP